MTADPVVPTPEPRDLLTEIEARHMKFRPTGRATGRVYCDADEQLWPCDAIRLLALAAVGLAVKRLDADRPFFIISGGRHEMFPHWPGGASYIAEAASAPDLATGYVKGFGDSIQAAVEAALGEQGGQADAS